MVAGGRAWLWGGMCGCRGVCMVVGGHAWLGGHVWLRGGTCGYWGVCVVVGGMRGCRGGACMVAGGACVVAGGHAWLPWGMRVCWGCIGYDKIRSMSGRYASYWNTFLLEKLLNFRPEGLSNI